MPKKYRLVCVLAAILALYGVLDADPVRDSGSESTSRGGLPMQPGEVPARRDTRTINEPPRLSKKQWGRWS